MNRDNKRIVYEGGLGFFGEITAHLSHDMKNVISIINELVGLLDDLLDAGGGNTNPAQIKQITGKINGQIKRCNDYIKTLNKFSHSVDCLRTTIELNEIVREVSALCQRLVRLQNASLAVNIPADPILIINNPFCLQHAVFICLSLALESVGVKRNAAFELNLSSQGTEACIEIVAKQGLNDEVLSTNRELLALLMEELGARFEISQRGGCETSLQISVPSSIHRE